MDEDTQSAVIIVIWLAAVLATRALLRDRRSIARRLVMYAVLSAVVVTVFTLVTDFAYPVRMVVILSLGGTIVEAQAVARDRWIRQETADVDQEPAVTGDHRPEP